MKCNAMNMISESGKPKGLWDLRYIRVVSI